MAATVTTRQPAGRELVRTVSKAASGLGTDRGTLAPPDGCATLTVPVHNGGKERIVHLGAFCDVLRQSQAVGSLERER